MEESTGRPNASRERHGARPIAAAHRAPAVIGLDVGTSAVKGLLAGASGSFAAVRRGYRLDIGVDGRVELDAEVVWRAVASVIRSLSVEASARDHRVVGLCCGGSGDEVVLLDERDRPIAPVVMSFDRRSDLEGRDLVETVGVDAFVETTGLVPSGGYPLPRLLWLRRTAPETAARVRRILSWPEFVAARLGLEPIAEPTLAARSAGFDVRRARWDAGLLAVAGIAETALPELGATGAVVGVIRADIANRFGLGLNVAVAAGGFDQAMATRGAGIDRSGIAHLGTGSWEAVSLLTDRPRFDLVGRGFSVGPAIEAVEPWSVMASSPGATALDWLGGLGRSIGVDRPTTGSGIRRVLAAAARAADQPTGILVVPDLDGSRDSSLAGGAMAGLRLDVDAATMARGVLEGIAFDVADELDLLSVEGLDVAEIRVSGGGASDARLLQLRADVIGIPVVGVDPRDTGVAAAAAMAWRAAVGDRSMTDALASLVRLGPAVEPRAGHHQRYAELRARRRALRMALAEPVDRRLATRR